MKLPRPYIPLPVRVLVSEKLVGSLGGYPFPGYNPMIFRDTTISLSQRLDFNLNLAARLKGLPDGKGFHLDHDPPLGARRFSKRTGKYRPDANDPDHLFYRTKQEHRTKTLVHGDHGQYSDIALIKRERRRLRKKARRKIRERLAQAGEPCGGFLSTCENPQAHTEYFNLPYQEKMLMMKEREKARTSKSPDKRRKIPSRPFPKKRELYELKARIK